MGVTSQVIAWCFDNEYTPSLRSPCLSMSRGFKLLWAQIVAILISLVFAFVPTMVRVRLGSQWPTAALDVYAATV